MNLTAKKRTQGSKGITKKIRRDGGIPAIVYGSGKPGIPIEIDAEEFTSIIRVLKPDHLSTTVFTLDLEGRKSKTIVKGIEYDLTTYSVIHLDFEILEESVPVTLKVPIECTGAAECVGVKQGGFLRQIIRKVKVKCLPKHIPYEFSLDVRELGIKQSKRLSDIQMPEGVNPITTTDEVVVVIAKR